MGAQGDPQRGRVREVLERPHDRRVRRGDLARRAVPGALKEAAMIHDVQETVKISPLAGKPAPQSLIVDLARLEREYYDRKPDVGDPTQLVAFGTSGHRGPAF